MATKTYKGSCHCGAVKYQADIDLSKGTMKCNCHLCTKMRSWKVFIKPEGFKLIFGADQVSEYHGKNPTAQRFFCKTCGIYLYEIGDAEWMGGPFVGIFLNSLDDASIDELMEGSMNFANGRDDDWMNTPRDVRNL